MQSHQISQNDQFVGRSFELGQLASVRRSKEASLVVVYGRRRIGKTELIEQFFRLDTVLKFEGIQTDLKDTRQARQYQIRNCLHRLASYLENPMIEKVACERWTEFFELLDPIIAERPVVIYFEEIQWLSHYQAEFLAELKPIWDDRWRHRGNLVVVICGSSPSFVMSQLVNDKALYGRCTHEFHLRPFSLYETGLFLTGMGPHEKLLAHLLVGGVPAYLKLAVKSTSVLQGICENAFVPDSYLLNEPERIFVSSMRSNPHYRRILQLLSRQRFATRTEIQTAIGVAAGGGSLTNVLMDLEKCGFVERYVPVGHEESSLLTRYAIADEFLNFHYRHVYPRRADIQRRRFIGDPLKGLALSRLSINLGFCFERWCRRNSDLFARIIGFSAVDYQSGAFYSRKAAREDPGFQIDLVFVRADRRILICEVKYQARSSDARKIFLEVDRKKTAFLECDARHRNFTCETALIAAEILGEKSVLRSGFDHVITLEDILTGHYWQRA